MTTSIRFFLPFSVHRRASGHAFHWLYKTSAI